MNRVIEQDGFQTVVDVRGAAPSGVFVTRVMLRERFGTGDKYADDLADALGIPPEPPKVAPWEVAYEAHYGTFATSSTREAWQAAVEFCVEQIKSAPVDGQFSRAQIIKRILGDA